jgi:hypothetical protein
MKFIVSLLVCGMKPTVTWAADSDEKKNNYSLVYLQANSTLLTKLLFSSSDYVHPTRPLVLSLTSCVSFYTYVHLYQQAYSRPC